MVIILAIVFGIAWVLDQVKGALKWIEDWWEDCFIKRWMDEMDKKGGFWPWFKDVLKSWWDSFVAWWNSWSLVDWIQGAWDWIKSFKVWQYVKNLVLWLTGKIVNFWNGICDSIAELSVSYPTGFEPW
jgi:hypothetical protein